MQFHCLNVIPVSGRVEFREDELQETIPRSLSASNIATDDFLTRNWPPIGLL